MRLRSGEARPPQAREAETKLTMQTPNSQAGALTERIMEAITVKIGKMPKHNYNRIYEAVLETLSKESAPLIAHTEFQAIRDAFHGGKVASIKTL